MGFRPTAEELAVLIEEIDEDGSGAIEFGEFAQLCAKFLVEVRRNVRRFWKPNSDHMAVSDSPFLAIWSFYISLKQFIFPAEVISSAFFSFVA